jgi:hypothetical protein
MIQSIDLSEHQGLHLESHLVHDQLVAGVEGVHVDGEHGYGREPEAPHLLRAPQRGACHIESY